MGVGDFAATGALLAVIEIFVYDHSERDRSLGVGTGVHRIHRVSKFLLRLVLVFVRDEASLAVAVPIFAKISAVTGAIRASDGALFDFTDCHDYAPTLLASTIDRLGQRLDIHGRVEHLAGQAAQADLPQLAFVFEPYDGGDRDAAQRRAGLLAGVEKLRTDLLRSKRRRSRSSTALKHLRRELRREVDR